jgi:hypothetical protein
MTLSDQVTVPWACADNKSRQRQLTKNPQRQIVRRGDAAVQHNDVNVHLVSMIPSFLCGGRLSLWKKTCVFSGGQTFLSVIGRKARQTGMSVLLIQLHQVIFSQALCGNSPLVNPKKRSQAITRSRHYTPGGPHMQCPLYRARIIVAPSGKKG